MNKYRMCFLSLVQDKFICNAFMSNVALENSLYDI